MPIKNCVDVIDTPYPRPKKITRKLLDRMMGNRFLLRCPIRLSLGRICTDDELESRREEAMKPLWEDAPDYYSQPAKPKAKSNWFKSLFRKTAK